jgi:FKBP-type peptidyl-prolyl cis-trans isomerase FkpA
MRLWLAGIAGGIVGLTVGGCEPPDDIIQTAPPGAIVTRTDPAPEVAQAQGEMAAPEPGAANSPDPLKNFEAAEPTAKGETKTTKGGVKYETIKEGTGPALKAGQAAMFRYTGKLEKGDVFDTTSTNNEPRKFRVGVDPLIRGWEEAVPGMKVGETRKLIIPPALGYQEAGKAPQIPPNATLIFEIELVEISR